jgi:tetratricopeptide (TPR) repeat protein
MLAGLCVVLAASSVRADETVVLRTNAGRQAALTGEILDYDVAELRIRLSDGREQIIPADKVVRVDAKYLPEQVRADQARKAGRHRLALSLYRKALAAEPRRWVRHAIIRQMIWCHRALGQIEQAGELFLLLARDGPNLSDLASMPLAWASGAPSARLERAAGTWMSRTDLPAAVLLGASHVLSTRRAEATRRLKQVMVEADGPVAQLAGAQLWRTEIIVANAEKTDAWRQGVARMPEALRAGPHFVLGQALARQGQYDQAALNLLRVPILYPREETLSAVALVEAGRVLEKQKRIRQAVGLYREVLRDHASSPAAGEAKDRLEELSKNKSDQ